MAYLNIRKKIHALYGSNKSYFEGLNSNRFLNIFFKSDCYSVVTSKEKKEQV